MEESFLNKIQQQLLSEEIILWTGKPDDKKLFTVQDILLIPLSLIFLVSALGIELARIIMLFDSRRLLKDSSGGSGVVLSIGGIIVIILMYYLSIGRFLVKKKYKKNTIYAVTNKRVLVLSNYKPFKKIIEKNIKDTSNILMTVNNGDNGTLKFGEINSPNKLFIRSPLIGSLMFPIEEIPVFYDIDEVKKVHALVNNIKNNNYHKK